MKQTLILTNMSCQHCVKRVTEALSRLTGVKGVQVDLEAKTATVTTDVVYSQTDYQTALEDTVYEVTAVN